MYIEHVSRYIALNQDPQHDLVKLVQPLVNHFPIVQLAGGGGGVVSDTGERQEIKDDNCSCPEGFDLAGN